MAFFRSIFVLSCVAHAAFGQGTPSCPTPMATTPKQLVLSVHGLRDAAGNWTKDVVLDFSGQQSPEKWDVDFQEETANEDNYSFTATARVLGSSPPKKKAPEMQRLQYVYRGDARNFTDAHNVCKDMGANLAVINSDEESVFLGSFAHMSRNSSSENRYSFIGFYSTDPKQWETVEGTSLAESGFTRWERTEPNNSSSLIGNGTRVYENCGSMGLEGLLNDIPCEIRLPFICEFHYDPCEGGSNVTPLFH